MTKSPPFTRSVPLLRSLHWLPVKFRILFKIRLLTYKTLHEKQPAASLSSRSLRSNKGIHLSVSRVKTNTGTSAFHSCAPSPWNNLPLSVHSAIAVATFKEHLKTHLFDLTFSPETPARPMAHWCCFIHFAVEHWFDRCTTKSGFARYIGAIEIWLIHSLI